MRTFLLCSDICKIFLAFCAGKAHTSTHSSAHGGRTNSYLQDRPCRATGHSGCPETLWCFCFEEVCPMFHTWSHRPNLKAHGISHRHLLKLEELEVRTVPAFLAPVTYPLGPTAVEPIIADLNNDGIPDLAVAVPGAAGANGTVNVFLGINNGSGCGTGAFNAGGTFAVGINPNGLRAGDLNNDGKIDLVTGNFNGTSISVLLGNGDGTFQAAVNYAAGLGSDRLGLGDIDGDGYLDVAVGNFNAGTVSILRNNGNGTFGPKLDIATGSIPAGVEVADLNGDGFADVTVDNENSATVTVLISNGDGTFKPAANYGTGA